MKMKEQYLLDVQSSIDKKLATTQDRQTLQNSNEKQYCQWWMLLWLLPTRMSAQTEIAS